MFHYDGGLKITSIDLAVDFRRRQPRGFISHAHTDHMARHELAFCTPATAALYARRYGERQTRAMPFGQSITWDDVSLSTHPAGHVLGSAMLLVEHQGRKLLYTGDFKLSASATAEPAAPPRADTLVMECTYGNPSYCLPPRDEVIAQLVATASRAIDSGRTPVIYAYVLGKAQEVTRILTSHGFSVVQHPLIYEISRVYEAHGCSLGAVTCYDGPPPLGAVVIAPPRSQKAAALTGLVRPITIAVTGWAVHPGVRIRLGVDYALPLSDHADFHELLDCIDRVNPTTVYCTHGPTSFVTLLRRRGIRAHSLDDCTAGPLHESTDSCAH